MVTIDKFYKEKQAKPEITIQFSLIHNKKSQINMLHTETNETDTNAMNTLKNMFPTTDPMVLLTILQNNDYELEDCIDQILTFNQEREEHVAERLSTLDDHPNPEFDEMSDPFVGYADDGYVEYADGEGFQSYDDELGQIYQATLMDQYEMMREKQRQVKADEHFALMLQLSDKERYYEEMKLVDDTWEHRQEYFYFLNILTF
eukprot:TRINITY_DN4477_c0_g1_i2.p1 TRINITY_DN4477_c0_g1~~TRINITY_DN4477_c0_g1_i2.p1  ORF type:complete len:203 (-),score=43.02 TRINITY_DN4477_c0_g1_i2:294-902(-)